MPEAKRRRSDRRIIVIYGNSPTYKVPSPWIRFLGRQRFYWWLNRSLLGRARKKRMKRGWERRRPLLMLVLPCHSFLHRGNPPLHSLIPSPISGTTSIHQSTKYLQFTGYEWAVEPTIPTTRIDRGLSDSSIPAASSDESRQEWMLEC